MLPSVRQKVKGESQYFFLDSQLTFRVTDGIIAGVIDATNNARETETMHAIQITTDSIQKDSKSLVRDLRASLRRAGVKSRNYSTKIKIVSDRVTLRATTVTLIASCDCNLNGTWYRHQVTMAI